jgi:hypothetical protein
MRTMKRNKRQVMNTNNEETNTEKKTVNASDDEKTNKNQK